MNNMVDDYTSILKAQDAYIGLQYDTSLGDTAAVDGDLYDVSIDSIDAWEPNTSLDNVNMTSELRPVAASNADGDVNITFIEGNTSGLPGMNMPDQNQFQLLAVADGSPEHRNSNSNGHHAAGGVSVPAGVVLSSKKGRASKTKFTVSELEQIIKGDALGNRHATSDHSSEQGAHSPNGQKQSTNNKKHDDADSDGNDDGGVAGAETGGHKKKNREAAAQSRLKKKIYVATLEHAFEKLQSANAELQANIQLLQQQNQQLAHNRMAAIPAMQIPTTLHPAIRNSVADDKSLSFSSMFSPVFIPGPLGQLGLLGSTVGSSDGARYVMTSSYVMYSAHVSGRLLQQVSEAMHAQTETHDECRITNIDGNRCECECDLGPVSDSAPASPSSSSPVPIPDTETVPQPAPAPSSNDAQPMTST